MARTARRNAAVDFHDEDAVLAEMAKELKVDLESMSIRVSENYSNFGDANATIYEIEVGEGKYPQEYFVAENDDDAETLAIAMVTQDLEHEPEIFNQDWLAGHIDDKKLRDALHSDTLNMNVERLGEERASDFWKMYEAEGFDVPEEDEDGDIPDPTDEQIDELAERQTDDQLKDPIAYLEDIYGKEDAVKQAMQIAGIDIEAAAEEAVSTDGAGHFLSPYDGQTNDTPSGFVYWRHN